MTNIPIVVVPVGTTTIFLGNNIAVTHNSFFANLSSRYAVKLIATSIVNGSRKTITRYLPCGRYDRMMVISNPLGCHSDIRADSVMESTCLLYKYFLYCHYAVGVDCLDDVEALYRLL